mmetsp:Transcript_35562/g.112196  ORF Transcript_35562/g.112196 Transcript_35562/m.112196 type:complete len:210 (-) Transcript_35562:1455-2084(-)
MGGMGKTGPPRAGGDAYAARAAWGERAPSCWYGEPRRAETAALSSCRARVASTSASLADCVQGDSSPGAGACFRGGVLKWLPSPAPFISGRPSSPDPAGASAGIFIFPALRGRDEDASSSKRDIAVSIRASATGAGRGPPAPCRAAAGALWNAGRAPSRAPAWLANNAPALWRSSKRSCSIRCLAATSLDSLCSSAATSPLTAATCAAI